MPFQEIIRIQKAEAEALRVIEQARAEADSRISAAHGDARKTEADALHRARAEVAEHIAAVEDEASADAAVIGAASEEEVAAILEAIDARLDDAITFVVGEVTGVAQTRRDG